MTSIDTSAAFKDADLATTTIVQTISALPTWLHFDATAKTLVGTPMIGNLGDMTTVVLTGTDPKINVAVTQTFTITVIANPPPTIDYGILHGLMVDPAVGTAADKRKVRKAATGSLSMDFTASNLFTDDVMTYSI